MKRSVLLTMILFAFSLQNFANSQMTGWSWINDDGDETNATFMARQDATPVTITSRDQVIRLRVRIDNPDSDNYMNSLFYTTNPAIDSSSSSSSASFNFSNEGFTEVGSDALFDWATSNYVTDGTATDTRDILYISQDANIYQSIFNPGEFISSSRSIMLKSQMYTELEYSIKPTENIVPGNYYFIPGGDVYVYYGSNNQETLASLSYQGSITPPVKVDKAIRTDSVKTAIGNNFTIPVQTAKMTKLDSVYSYQFDFTYDPTIIKYASYLTDGTLSQRGTTMVNSTENGKLKIGFASSTPITGTGPLVYLNFNALQADRTTPVISNFLFNTDSVKNATNSPIDIYSIFLGDLDENISIQAYDGALVMQYSVGLDPLPSIDPRPWSEKRFLAADVDGNGSITAYDAALILQKSINLISTFPVNNQQINTTTDTAFISIEQIDNNLLFKAYGNPIGINIATRDNLDILGNPLFIKDVLTATNISKDIYSIGLATASVPKEGTTLLTIPIKSNSVKNMSFDLTVNNSKSIANVNITTALAGTKNASFTVYPNPSSDFIHIDNMKAGSVLSIYDLTGRKLTGKTAATNSETIAIGNLSAGFYNLVITNGKDKTVTKIIKK